MFFSHITEARRLNRIDLSAYAGKRCYYNKVRNYISLIFKTIPIILFPVSCIFLGSGEKEAALGYLFLTAFFCLLLIDSIFENIGRLLLKNPVFILKGELLFYLHTQKSYDIRNHSFSDEMVGRHNYYETFCMFNKNKKRIFAEKNWHLKDEEVFKSQIKYNQLILAQEVNH